MRLIFNSVSASLAPFSMSTKKGFVRVFITRAIWYSFSGLVDDALDEDGSFSNGLFSLEHAADESNKIMQIAVIPNRLIFIGTLRLYPLE
jgi:hypothetical protein